MLLTGQGKKDEDEFALLSCAVSWLNQEDLIISEGRALEDLPRIYGGSKSKIKVGKKIHTKMLFMLRETA